ncbi:MAG TPA: TldD/PmbA family protein, partial [Candidatus Ozemobacteraceae bacterium]|nr:TldD/PmbA family protein [Candidatus Ozemobacteraceae bacterium]
SCAGRSFATLEKYQKFRYGSDLVNFVADNTLERGLATYGYDDEGVECQKWHIVKDGIFVGYGVNREVAGMIGLKRANGTTRATRYCDVPIVRIPNLYLAPGTRPLSKQELIADTKKGIYIEGMGSFSIDQMRLNMQFGGDAFWEIKDGKIVGMLKNVTYNAISYEFWRSCDAICDEREFKRHGFLTCGKGDPMQLAQMTHGASPARFRNIMVRRAK